MWSCKLSLMLPIELYWIIQGCIGLYNIISTDIVNTLISLFTIFFTIFLYKCVNYNGILVVNHHDNLIEYIHWPNYFNLHWTIWTILIIFIIYIVFKLINIVDSITTYWKIQQFYNNELDIIDKDINTITWENIVIKLNNTLVLVVKYVKFSEILTLLY